MKPITRSLFFLALFLGACMPRPRSPQSPEPSTRQIGLSVQNRLLTVYTLGSGKTRILILAGIHGSEGTSTYVAEHLLDLLTTHPELVKNKTIAIYPRANPDGLSRGIRTNANHVDLNRNFPARNWKRNRTPGYDNGPNPLSEPETRALHAYVEEFSPGVIITIHSIDRTRQQNNYDGPGRYIAEAMAPHNHYPVSDNIGYPTPGSLGSWAGSDLQIPTITLELPRTQPGPDAWIDNKDALLAAITAAK
jgi:murein peptide amidase A